MEKTDTNVGTAQTSGIQSRAVRIALIVIVFVLFIATAIINSLASGAGQKIGLYVNSTGGVSDFYYVEVTPAGWAFSIWGLIYFMQIAMILYFFVNVFRKNSNGSYLCCEPNFISVIFLCTYGSSYFVNIAWILVFDRSILNAKLLALCCVLLWMIFFSLAISLLFHYMDFKREVSRLMNESKLVDVWLTIILVQNGVSLYATWCSVAAPLNTAFGFAYVHGVAQKDASTIALSILAFEIVLYVSLDTFLLDRWTRFTITPHCVLVWALTASITKNYRSGERNSIFIAILLALAVAALVEKIILIIVRQLKDPMYTGKVGNSETQLVGYEKKAPMYDGEQA